MIVRFFMRFSRYGLAALTCAVFGAVPTPKEHLGFAPGDDYKLADYAQISGYFQKLARSSDRIKLAEFGRSSLGKPTYVAFISAPENLKKLDRYRDISRRLALGQASAEEARALSEEGKAVVWIDSGLHASEVATAQHSPELAYRMLTGESALFETIRRNVILMQVPVINPDGLDWIVNWYRENVGTPYESAPLPWLYQKYAGHDNNRDWFMLNLVETRNVTRLLFHEWFPQIVYNQHQAPAFPARTFVPPYAEPLNPHIPAAVMEGINLIGSAIKERFARENKPGILSYHGYDAWWNGGLRSVPAFHNMHGILTETALNSYGTPRVYSPSEFPASFANGIPTKEPSVFYQRPWMGGKWGTRDAIEYMLTADFAILQLAAERRADYLLKSFQLAQASIAAGGRGKPFAYLVPPDQFDRAAALEMLERLQFAGVIVKRAQAPFQANGKTFPEGTYVMPAAQPFRPYLMDLMEPQKYPELKTAVGGSTKRPYDIAGWTLPMSMGVMVERVEDPFEAGFDAKLRDEAPIQPPTPQYSVRAGGRQPKIALYEPYTANMDQGWTQWLLDRYRIPHTLLHNADFSADKTLQGFDTVILASQTATSILHGTRDGEFAGDGQRAGEDRIRTVAVQRPQYTGGIGLSGLARLHKYVQDGGTLVALDNATELPIQFFPLPVRNVARAAAVAEGSTAAAQFYSPGSLLRMTVDTAHPLAAGMPKDIVAFSSGGHAFDLNIGAAYNKGEREVRTVVRFATSNLLASGWVSGERVVLGKAAMLEARHGKGRVVLFGFRPQFRGQTHATFRLLLNAIYQ
ncbi:MAG: hypothetical protein EXQ52_05165 [Bryobacterales bacterium]|nr:hypothetical protein [Bryobacterales bacterium]